MKSGLDLVVAVIDRSGSMSSCQQATIGGFNEFIKGQLAVPRECRLTLIQFDHEYEVVHSQKPLNEFPPLSCETYVPRGSTALLDAMGRAINSTGEELAKLPEDQRPEKVVFVVVTDGLENASTEFTRAKIFEMVEHQKKNYNWTFIYLGANQDAITEGAKLGANVSQGYLATPDGVRCMYGVTGQCVTSFRTGQP